MTPHCVRLVVEYDGTDFSGWQTQGQGKRTVQSVLQDALENLCGQHSVVLHGAGRTDTGVHALGQVASVHLVGGPPTERLMIALNSLLPRDVSVASAEDAPDNFHARFSAKSRTYVYWVWTRRARSAIWGRYSLHFRQPLETALMREAAQNLIGSHDFASFARAGGDPGITTRRDVQHLSVRRLANGSIIFVVTANGFLRSMVRNFVGALLVVGRGEMSPSAVRDILETRDRTRNPCAPAAPHGLCLLRVEY